MEDPPSEIANSPPFEIADESVTMLELKATVVVVAMLGGWLQPQVECGAVDSWMRFLTFLGH